MKIPYKMQCTLPLLASIILLVQINCTSRHDDKIPITTSSEEALNAFIEGRDLYERLHNQEALTLFEKAISADPDFAMAYLFLASAQPTTKGFYENLNQAAARADMVSNGEKWWILGVQAGVNDLPMEESDYFKKLVVTYPRDERAYNLLGNHYFGLHMYREAIEEFNKAIEINPDFSQPYNRAGYAHRYLGQFKEAEEAFVKYIGLIPDDPNPYDSYAELLMSMGEYDKSIEYYRKALAIDPGFVASHIGIATNLNLKGDHEGARKQLQELYDNARNDGDRREALFAMTVSYADEHKMDNAMAEQEKEYALAKKINDASAMADNLITMGDIQLECGKPGEALAKYKKSMETIEASDLSQAMKDNAKRIFLFNAGRVALEKNDLETAKARCAEYYEEVKAINNMRHLWRAHQLMGLIALEEKDYDEAINEFKRADQQDPFNCYSMALAFKGLGDMENAREACIRCVNCNALNDINHAFIRHKAEKLLASI